jgi:hypothetical protein
MQSHVSFAGGLRAILTDQNKLVVFVGGVTALAAGVYTTQIFKLIFFIFLYLYFYVLNKN